jgi:hypothetical protein
MEMRVLLLARDRAKPVDERLPGLGHEELGDGVGVKQVGGHDR